MSCRFSRLWIIIGLTLSLFPSFSLKAAQIYFGPALVKPKCPFWAVEFQRKDQIYQCIYHQKGILLIDNKVVYLFAGIGSVHPIGSRLDLYMSFSPGLYFQKEILNLGCVIEFRSCVELAWYLNPKLKLATQLFHLSNAHLSSRNPGVNGSTISLGFIL